MIIDIVRRQDTAHILFNGIPGFGNDDIEVLAVAFQLQTLRQVEQS